MALKLSVIISNSAISLIVFVLSDSFDYTDGHTGGGLWHGSRSWIMDTKNLFSQITIVRKQYTFFNDLCLH